MWTYKSRTGELIRPDGTSFGYGFSGQRLGLNEPSKQYEKMIGPIPAGKFILKAWIQKHPKLGLCCIDLDPAPGVDLGGRSDFLIHGYRDMFKNGMKAFLESSNGCICIGDCNTRKQIWDSPDHKLFVDPS